MARTSLVGASVGGLAAQPPATAHAIVTFASSSTLTRAVSVPATMSTVPSSLSPPVGTVRSTSWPGVSPDAFAATVSAAAMRLRNPLCVVLSCSCWSAATASALPIWPSDTMHALGTLSLTSHPVRLEAWMARSASRWRVGTTQRSRSPIVAHTAARARSVLRSSTTIGNMPHRVVVVMGSASVSRSSSSRSTACADAGSSSSWL